MVIGLEKAGRFTYIPEALVASSGSPAELLITGGDLPEMQSAGHSFQAAAGGACVVVVHPAPGERATPRLVIRDEAGEG